MRALRLLSAVLLAVVALASASACQVALRAEDEDALCTPSGKPCGPGMNCKGGVCRPCVPKPEECNFEDDDCDGEVDEDFDQDHDGFTICGQLGVNLDCNDDPSKGGADIHPGAKELCNGIDDNCDGRVDEAPASCTDGTLCVSARAQCISSTDCRQFGCPKGKGCNVTTGECSDPDCRSNPSLCRMGIEECDQGNGRCVKVTAIGDACDNLAKCSGSPAVSCVDLIAIGVSGRAPSICSKACCDASGCPDGFVCRMGTSGASVCVRAADVSLTVGTGPANVKCVKPDDCRSGICANGSCIDGCCGTPECGSLGTCSIKSDNRFNCRSPVGTKPVEGSCDRSSDCATGYCVGASSWGPGKCTKHCCSSSDCPTNWNCQPFHAGAAVITMCQPIPWSPGTGPSKGGAACAASGDCRSNLCQDKTCTDFCCRDTDCAPGAVCRLGAAEGGGSAMKCTKLF